MTRTDATAIALLLLTSCGGGSSPNAPSAAAQRPPLPHPPQAPPTALPDPSIVAMIAIPGGSFWRGCDEGDPSCPRDEQPRRRINLAAFAFDATPVTVAAYRRCAREGACSEAGLGEWARGAEHHASPSCNYPSGEREDHPMSCVDWTQAGAYCAWVKKRLPSEAEWEKAVRGVDGPRAPWGGGGPSCAFATIGTETPQIYNLPSCPAAPSRPVAGAGTGPRGPRDLPGNVWELMDDFYEEGYYALAESDDPRGPSRGNHHAIRGLRWYGANHLNSPESAQGTITLSTRRGADRSLRSYDLGFRCARSPS